MEKREDMLIVRTEQNKFIVCHSNTPETLRWRPGLDFYPGATSWPNAYTLP